VVNHHQIAVLSLEFFLVGFDLYLALHRPLFVHRVGLPEMPLEVTTAGDSLPV
jgi:hypothetical protein